MNVEYFGIHCSELCYQGHANKKIMAHDPNKNFTLNEVTGVEIKDGIAILKFKEKEANDNSNE